MSVASCIEELIDTNAIERDIGEEILRLARKLRRDNEKIHPPEIADARAKEGVQEIIDQAASRQKQLAARRANATALIDQQMRAHPKGLATGALSHLVRDLDANVAAPWANVETQARTFLGLFHSVFADGIEALRPRLAGTVRRTTLQKNVLKELFGQDSGDSLAKEVGQAWAKSAEFARKQFNSYGGAMAERNDWGLPQSHDPKLVNAVSKQEWIDFIMPLLNRDKMIDFDTKAPLTDERLLQLLERTYDRIRTNGLVDLNPGASGGRGVLANRHQDHRFLSFKDAESWTAYQKQFGQGADIYGTMTQHLEVMAKDAAMLKVLGPDPDGMVRFMTDTIRKEAAEAGEKNPTTKLRNIQNVYEVLTDRINDGADEPMARAFAGTRNVLTAAQLGGAFLSAISDFAFTKITAKFNGIPTMGVLRDYLKQMNPLSGADRQLAIQMGFVAESSTSVALAQKRFFGEVMGPRITQLFSDVVLRASLLTPHTQAMRHAFGMEFMGFLARNSDKPIEQLDQPMQDTFARYGISDVDWDVIRKAPKMKAKGGAEFINVREVAKLSDGEAAHKLQQAVLTEMDFATPVPGARERAIVTGGTKPGTLVGEVMRNIAMYKSFPVTVLSGHVMRGVLQSTQGQKGKAGKYLAGLFIYTTVMGALAVQMKQMQRGKDPITMNARTQEGRKFWGSALLQGGGVGIFGDFLFADANRFGSSPAMTFAGPVAKFADDSVRLTLGNVQQAIKGEKTNASSEFVRFTGQYFPGSSLWYGRLAFERMVLDQMQLAVDDKARSKFRRRETTARKNFGQKYWWRPGKLTPKRAPDFAATIDE